MDFMKVLDQTVREIKREVNLKVLKVPEIEQKVLDATSDEPWGPHGSALTEIAQATKKFSENQMIMNALWTRLTDAGSNWRHVYKALTVIEYLVANGSERALDDILEHSFQISSKSGFEYVEPNGKDVGINVRKKVETILSLLNDKEKIQAVRAKAAATRDKYFGLSSSGITYKSSSASNSSSSFHHNDHYGGLSGSKEGDSFKDSYKDRDKSGEEADWNHDNKEGRVKSRQSHDNDNEGNKSKKGVTRHGRDQDSKPSSTSKSSTKHGPTPSSKSSSLQTTSIDDDFDDFDPRGSSTAGSAAASSKEVDLFGDSLVGDLMDTSTFVSTQTNTADSGVPEVDLFADATFVSASSHVEATGSNLQGNVDLFAKPTAFPASFPSKVDLFAVPDSSLPTESSNSGPMNTNTFDPFAALPLNNFEGSEVFGDFTSHSDSVTLEPSQSFTDNNLNQATSIASKPPPKKDAFQVKSGIWADSLSRGLIDLNITAPKKTSLADIGIIGGLSDGSDDNEKGPPALYVGRAMGAGSGLGRSAFPSSTGSGGIGSLSGLSHQQYGSFK